MINSVQLTGRLTADPELRYTEGGVPVTNFRLAVQRPFSNGQGQREADFFTVVAWRQAAELAAKHLSKGRLIGVEGRLQSRSWKAPDGSPRSVVEVVANQITFLDKKPANGNGNGNGGNAEPAAIQSAEPQPAAETPLLS